MKRIYSKVSNRSFSYIIRVVVLTVGCGAEKTSDKGKRQIKQCIEK